MIVVSGTYKDGYVKLDKKLSIKNTTKVTVTFPENVEESIEGGLKLTDFSFLESQELLRNFKGSFSDAVIEERKI